MFNENTATEKELYEESRRLKFKAREARKLRVEREAKYAKDREERLRFEKAARIKKAEEDAKAYKIALDNRIRSALVETAKIFKLNNLAFEAPSQYWYNQDLKNSFNIIDTSQSDPVNGGKKIKINTVWNGFQWD